MKALLIIDLQNDFMPGGSLAVKDGHKVVPIANLLMVESNFDVTICTADYHPPTHMSFASNNKDAKVGTLGELNGVPQVWWPNHCEWGTKGAEFHKNLMANLNTGKVAAFFRKGMNEKVDSYSGFFDNKAIFDGKEVRAATGLGGYLKDKGVTDVYVMGLATDYCVKFTALDAVALGFNTYLVTDGCRAVDLNAGDGDKAVVAMKEAGVKLVESKSLLVKLNA